MDSDYTYIAHIPRDTYIHMNLYSGYSCRRSTNCCILWPITLKSLPTRSTIAINMWKNNNIQSRHSICRYWMNIIHYWHAVIVRWYQHHTRDTGIIDEIPASAKRDTGILAITEIWETGLPPWFSDLSYGRCGLYFFTSTMAVQRPWPPRVWCERTVNEIRHRQRNPPENIWIDRRVRHFGKPVSRDTGLRWLGVNMPMFLFS